MVIQDFDSIVEVPANETTVIDFGEITGSEDRYIKISDFKVNSLEFREYVKLVPASDKPKLVIETSPPISFAGDTTVVTFNLVNLDPLNPSEETYFLAVTVLPFDSSLVEANSTSTDDGSSSNATTPIVFEVEKEDKFRPEDR